MGQVGYSRKGSASVHPHAGKSLKHGRDGKAGEAAGGGRGRQTWGLRARRDHHMQLV